MPLPADITCTSPGWFDVAVAQAVAVLERAVDDVGDDLHVAVRVDVEPSAAVDDVVVEDAAAARVHVVRDRGNRANEKCQRRIEPAVVGVVTVVRMGMMLIMEFSLVFSDRS